MPRTTEANQQIREAQRAKILDSARRVFARKGMAATIADIAADAEMSVGLAYRYFADKDAILSALARQILPDASTAMQQLLESSEETPGQRLELLFSRILAARGYPAVREIHQIVSIHADAMPDDVRELLSKRYQLLLSTVRQLIIEGQDTGEIASGDPDQLVAVVSACLDGMTRWAVHDPEQFNKYVPDAQIFMRLLKG